LRLPDFEKVFILQTDACNDGIGAILLQEESGIKYPVAFASRKLLTRESLFNYWKRMFSHCVGSAKVSEHSVWEVFHFGDRPSGIVAFGQSSVWTKLSSYETGVDSATISVYC